MSLASTRSKMREGQMIIDFEWLITILILAVKFVFQM